MATKETKLPENILQAYRELHDSVTLPKLLSQFTLTKGKLYEKTKFMLVGRSPDHWQNFDEQSIADLAQIRNDKGFEWTKDKTLKYKLNSAFWYTAKHTMMKLFDVPDTSDWCEYMIWTNLYPISPIEGGNAVGKLQEIQRDAARKLLQLQIEYYAPKYILFTTDWDGWFAPCEKGVPQFLPGINKISENEFDKEKTIVMGSGKYGGAKVVVTIRPDRWKYKPTAERFSDEVIKAFKAVC